MQAPLGHPAIASGHAARFCRHYLPRQRVFPAAYWAALVLMRHGRAENRVSALAIAAELFHGGACSVWLQRHTDAGPSSIKEVLADSGDLEEGGKAVRRELEGWRTPAGDWVMRKGGKN
jgi:hypothetical protein